MIGQRARALILLVHFKITCKSKNEATRRLVSQSVILTQSEGYQATKSASPLLHNRTVDILFRHFVIPLCIQSARRVKRGDWSFKG